MAGKMKRRRPFVVLALSAVLVGASTALFVSRTGVRNTDSAPYYETDVRLQTERTHIDVYDARHNPALIQSFTVSGLRNLTLKTTYPTGKPADFELRAGAMGETGKPLLHLPVDAAAAETIVDARWQNLYEMESGSPLSGVFGTVVSCRRSYFTSKSVPLTDAPAVPAPSTTAPIRIVVRPDMKSPLWDWERRTAMHGGNSRYYLSAYHVAGVPAKELAVAIARNPPRD